MQKQPKHQWLFFDEAGLDEAGWQLLLHSTANGDHSADPGQTVIASPLARRWWPAFLLLTGLALASFWLHPWEKAEPISTTAPRTQAVPVATTIGRRENRHSCLDLQMNPVEQHRSQLPPPYTLPEPAQPACFSFSQTSVKLPEPDIQRHQPGRQTGNQFLGAPLLRESVPRL